MHGVLLGHVDRLREHHRRVGSSLGGSRLGRVDRRGRCNNNTHKKNIKYQNYKPNSAKPTLVDSGGGRLSGSGVRRRRRRLGVIGDAALKKRHRCPRLEVIWRIARGHGRWTGRVKGATERLQKTKKKAINK